MMRRVRGYSAYLVMVLSVALLFGNGTAFANAPSAPTGVTVNASSTSEFEQATVRVTWSANTQVDGYTVYLRRTGTSTDLDFKTIAQANTTEWTFNNLAGGVSYSVQVIAIKSGLASQRSVAVSATPITKPKAPDQPTVSAGIRSATVTWSAVPAANNGGSPITSYLVTEVNSGKQVVALATDTTKELSGLSPGAAVEFTVAAVNSASASGSISTRSTALALANTPSAPSVSSALSAEDGKFTLTWTPAAAGGSAITSQKVYLYKNSVEVQNQSVAAGASTYTFTDLTAGTYQGKISATNAVGEGPLSSFSSAVAVAAVQQISVVNTPSSNNSSNSGNAGGGGGGGGGGFFGGGGGGGGFALPPAAPGTTDEKSEEEKKKLEAEELAKKKLEEEELAKKKKEEAEKAEQSAKGTATEDPAKGTGGTQSRPTQTVTPAPKSNVAAPKATQANKAEVLKVLVPNSDGVIALAKPAPTLASAVVAKTTARDTLQVAIKPPTIKSGERISSYRVVVTSASGKSKTLTVKANGAGGVNIKGLTSTSPYTLEISAVVNGKAKVVTRTKVTLATKKKR